ncbi:hypothetical protein Kpol_1029p20 [Vanderwaltozyma polyspora DSM 70294]|uniref:1-phosphatidylinositol-4-phosphate 5-kinase n=1 Tax=Vanderwaltozyma polyspora (strain ATCC 22028 / DSM 70294 / BCRC 21397 / CBS 2163 / NBRC 10782 / NRRL Y-8283 / UCD 57-17) TaxID=436907 RepID=A7TR78_VANPO|nr:uncharacterized protein Kpol_1029p20 [Vanderwaltozyma polyspora DSM 70294]EDO15246.1 hypothetical protein Kpol_1029p20 [Vanderwaltozyma polyspora DSM 70294]
MTVIHSTSSTVMYLEMETSNGTRITENHTYQNDVNKLHTKVHHKHTMSFHSSSNSDSNVGSPRSSDGESTSTSTSVDEVTSHKVLTTAHEMDTRSQQISPMLDSVFTTPNNVRQYDQHNIRNNNNNNDYNHNINTMGTDKNVLRSLSSSEDIVREDMTLTRNDIYTGYTASEEGNSSGNLVTANSSPIIEEIESHLLRENFITANDNINNITILSHTSSALENNGYNSNNIINNHHHHHHDNHNNNTNNNNKNNTNYNKTHNINNDNNHKQNDKPTTQIQDNSSDSNEPIITNINITNEDSSLNDHNHDHIYDINDNNDNNINIDNTQNNSKTDNNQNLVSDIHSILDTTSLIETGSFVHDINDDDILLNTKVSRTSTNVRKSMNEASRKSVPSFYSSKHSQIFPLDDPNVGKSANKVDILPNISMTSLPVPNFSSSEHSKNIRKCPSSSFTSLPPVPNHGALKRSESATAEIRKMRENLLHKREMKRSRKSFLLDDDRVLIGNKVSEGHVNFIIAYNMLTGIRVAVSRCSGIMKPLTSSDFSFTKKLAFDYHGNELTPSSQYAFKFKDYAPEVFRELRAMFGLDPADYLVSLTSKYILSELHSPGKSGSFFYYSRDYRYIIKTIHHSEHLHLRKHLNDYYKHVKENPDTLLCQFYGLHRIKMPMSFQNKIKHRKIYFIVMNNLFPPHLEMHATYDLKGSTWGRLTKVDLQKLKNDSNYKPVLKDLNWIDEHQHISLGPIKRQKFLEQLRKDVKLLAKLNTMDYSLLIGIHDIRKASRDSAISGNVSDEESGQEAASNSGREHRIDLNTNKPNSVVSHYFKEYEGGFRASDKDNKDLNIIYYVGIIDCLTNYSIIKKLETFWRGLGHDLKVVSAIPPRDYADRFYKFIESSTDASPQKQYKDNPNVRKYRD